MNTLMQEVSASGLDLPHPYLLFLGDVSEPAFAKTAFGLKDWAPELCLAEWALEGAAVTTGLPHMDPTRAAAAGARSLVIGVANIGGVLPLLWVGALVAALEAGLDLISGMHTPLDTISELKVAAALHDRRLIDVRRPPAAIPVGTGRRRTGRRLLTVGTDCALGKKYTALALARGLKRRGVDAQFRATGQTGILIAGGGLPVDAVVADFEAGAAEMLSPDAADDHWDVIEGQGSILHPAYAAVSLGLLHGSQPDVIVVCHQPGRINMLGLHGYPVPSLEETIELNLRLGARTNPAVRCAGISLNTAHLEEDERRRVLAETEAQVGLPAADPMRPGAPFEMLLDACLNAPAQ